MLKVLIPQAFENMEEATLGRWLKVEGEAVREGDALCELITEKTTFDLPAEGLDNGAQVLRKIVAPEKSIVPVGFCIALIGDESETLLDILLDVENENAAVLKSRQTADNSPQAVNLEPRATNLAPQSASTPAAGSRIRATPAARRAARERGISMEDIAAALPGKVLTEDDVMRFLA